MWERQYSSGTVLQFGLECCILHLQAETDRVKGLGVMLFHIEGTLDDLVSMEHFGV
jgi:hypothetical protein